MKANAWCALAMMLVTMGGAARAKADKPAALSAQTLKTPGGPASLKGLGESFSTDVATGTGSFSVPIDLPPARIRPSLALSYAAGAGKGALGLSWSLPLVSIYRTTDKGSPSYLETDRFAVSGPGLNDELVLVDPATRTYRLKNEGPYALFVRNPGTNSWTVRLSNGETLFMGESAQAREGTARGAYRWYVERQADKFQHEVRYAYTREQGRLYISEIRYQLQAYNESGTLVAIAPAFQNKVTFSYESRPDVFSDYSYGERITTALRLRSVAVTQGTRALRTYTLGYRNSLLFSLLTSVQMVGEGGLAMPALTFDYLEPTLTSGRYVTMVERPPLEGLLNGSAQLEDVNRDAFPDLLVGTAGNYRYYENIDGVSWNPTPISIAGSPDRNLYDGDVVMADFDGDGDRDLGHTHGNAFRYFPAGAVWKGTFQGFGAAVTLQTSDTGFNFTSREVKLTDLNSDGRTDLIWQKPGQDAQLVNTSDRLQSSYISDLPVDVDFQDSRVQLLDFNGDGILDFVRQEIGWNPSRVRVWYGLGNGVYAAEQQMLNVPIGDPAEFSLQDVNRDGQTDLVRVSGTHASYVLNDGNQRFTGARGDFYGLPSVSNTRRLMFADMNGNGTTDVVWLTLDGKLTYLDLVGEPFFGLLSRIDNGLGGVTEIAYESSTSHLAEAKRAGRLWSTTLPVPVPVITEVVTRDSLELLGVAAAEQRLSYKYGEGYYDGREREFRGFGVAVGTEWGDATHETVVTEQRFHVGRNLLTLADEEPLKGRPYLRIVRNLQDQVYQTVETNWEQRWLCQEALTGVVQVILPRCSQYPDKALSKDLLVTLAVTTATLTGSWEKSSAPRYAAAATEYDAWGRPIRERVLGEVTFPSARAPGSGFDLARANAAVGNDEVVQEVEYIDDIGDWLVGVTYQESVRSSAGTRLAHVRRYFDGARFVGLPLGQIDKGLVSREEVWLDTENRFIPKSRNEHNADGLVIAIQDANANLTDIAYDPETRNLPVRERLYVESGSIELSAKYDAALGAVIESTDGNGNVTKYTYDGLGRADKVIDPLGTLNVPAIDYDYAYGTSLQPISRTTVKTLVERGSATYRTSYQYTDAWGRTRLVKTEAEASHGYVAASYSELTGRGGANRVYDSFASRHAGFEAPPAGTPVVLRQLDALSRATDTYFPATDDLPMGRVHTKYLPFETIEYDERDTAESTWQFGAITRTDGQGRVVEVEKRNEQRGVVSTLLWKTVHDPLGRIREFMDPAWSSDATNPARDARSRRTYEYDSLGRLLKLTDPNLGGVSYEYDDASNLKKRIDALEQVEGYEYGLANRLQRRTFQRDARGKADYAYAYHYDEAAPQGPLANSRNLRGRIAWVEYPTGREHYSYDEAGRTIHELIEQWDPTSSSFSNQTRTGFARTQTVDAEGKPTLVDLPGGFSVAPTYNARGLLLGLTVGPAGAARPVLANVEYDARGLITRTDHGNGTRTCEAYDHRSKLIATLSGRGVTCGQYGSSSSSLGRADVGFQHLRYVRGFNHNIKSIRDLSERIGDGSNDDGIARLDAQYDYDRLNQLARARDVQGDFRFLYDVTQNLVERSFAPTAPSPRFGASTSLPTGTFTYGENGAGPNMVTSAGGRQYSYDRLGRLKAYNGYDLDYDVEGHLVTATKGAVRIAFHYDAWGERRLSIVQRASGTPEVYRHIFAEYEVRDGDETWLLGGGSTQVEVTKSKGVVVDDQLYLVDQLMTYAINPTGKPKPLPAEYMDLDGDGDFDVSDAQKALDAFGTKSVRERLGQPKLVWRYYHRDQLTGTTHATDSVGDLVNHALYDVYGKTSQQKGMATVRGFAGARLGPEVEIGLVRFGARFYAPDLGRWITPDRSIGESPAKMSSTLLESSLYNYAANNPIARRDPTGKESFVERKLQEMLMAFVPPSSRDYARRDIGYTGTGGLEAIQKMDQRLALRTARMTDHLAFWSAVFAETTSSVLSIATEVSQLPKALTIAPLRRPLPHNFQNMEKIAEMLEFRKRSLELAYDPATRSMRINEGIGAARFEKATGRQLQRSTDAAWDFNDTLYGRLDFKGPLRKGDGTALKITDDMVTGPKGLGKSVLEEVNNSSGSDAVVVDLMGLTADQVSALQKQVAEGVTNNKPVIYLQAATPK